MNAKLWFFAGSKEETFFDSHAWLDSDCEDDFLSVGGGKITNFKKDITSTIRDPQLKSNFFLGNGM